MDEKAYREAVTKIVTEKLVRAVVDTTVPGQSLPSDDARVLSAQEAVIPVIANLIAGRLLDSALSPGEQADRLIKVEVRPTTA
jgi:hypothetical protein